jgi:hypothetical protein
LGGDVQLHGNNEIGQCRTNARKFESLHGLGAINKEEKIQRPVQVTKGTSLYDTFCSIAVQLVQAIDKVDFEVRHLLLKLWIRTYQQQRSILSTILHAGV